MKKSVFLLILCFILLLGWITRLLSSDPTTDILIKNQTEHVIDGLIFSSNDNEEAFILPDVDPVSEFSFQYVIGGTNENAVQLFRLSAEGEKDIYPVVGYVIGYYSSIEIEILSVDETGKLELEVEINQ